MEQRKIYRDRRTQSLNLEKKTMTEIRRRSIKLGVSDSKLVRYMIRQAWGALSVQTDDEILELTME